MTSTIAFLTCLGAGIVGGMFFAFSTFVMKALAQLPPHQGVAAMQRINIVVINPLFLGVFMGTALLAVGCAIAAFVPWGGARSAWLLSSGVLYFVGTFLVTMRCNVPLNDRLARLDEDSEEAVAYWPVYVRQWSGWNHVRTAAAVLSAVCSAAALVI